MENNNRAGHAQINARGDCVDLAGAGSGRRNENPPALAVGSVNERKTAQYILKLKSGETFDVIEETNLYWVCKGTQFKKTSRQIERVTRRKARKGANDE